MSPEGRGVFANLSVRENLQMGAYLNKDRRAIAADMDRAFQMFPRLKEREAQKAGTLSGGEQQMLAIGRAADVQSSPAVARRTFPRPGAAGVHTIFEAIDEIRSKGTTILLVEQNAARRSGPFRSRLRFGNRPHRYGRPLERAGADPKIKKPTR